ncbi:MAG: DNRLRE domain-containing protein [Anaerolineae bacterium]|nr:DNRLRE domain-containing protein [Anaerolineae bacterium]
MKCQHLMKFLALAVLLASGMGLAAAQPVWAQAPGPDVPSACMAQETSYRATFSAERDSYVSEVAPGNNYGTNAGMSVGKVTIPSSGDLRSLVAFDIGGLPTDAIILTATLELYQTSGASFDIKAQALTGAWSENAVTWDNQPAFTTTNEIVEGSAVAGWRRWNLTPMVRQWHAGTLDNQGVRLIFNFGVTGLRGFSSREAATNPPRLVVEYRRQITLTSLADTSISQASPGSNSGNAINAIVGRNADTLDESYALIQFDLSAIPASSTVISASLGLFPQINRMSPTAPQFALGLDLEGILATWDEMNVTWNNQPGSQAMGDPTTVWDQGMTWNWLDITQIAQAWTSGALVNYGVMIKPSGVTTGTADFVTREGANDPQLVIVYGPPPCYPASDANISGPSQGITDTAYTFNANITPVTATLPITYTWEADEQAPSSGASADVTYTWNTPGWKTITVTVANCESSVVGTHQVSITVPSPTCEFPLTGLSLAGPTQGLVDAAHTFTATASPANATLPVTYTWEADGQTPASGAQAAMAFTWSTTGAKHITVTAENCGGVFVQYHTLNVLDAAELPDVLISGMWYNPEEMRAYYILKNVGNSATPAGQTINLFQGITEVVQISYPGALQPGWVRSGFINYEWTCSVGATYAQICADAGDAILESDEDNNCYKDIWACDITPPQIVAGPVVINITEHTARIIWQTDEPCRSRLDYSRSGASGSVLSIEDNSYKTDNHAAVLENLDNASTYWYRIYVSDESGNLNNSSNAYFETLPPGTDPLVITDFGMADYALSTNYEFYVLSATLEDAAGADRVTFLLDGDVVGTDYDAIGNTFEVYFSPAAAGLTRSEWFGIEHRLVVRAYNLENEDTADNKLVTPWSHPMPGRVVIVSPDPGKVIYIDGETAPSGTSIDSLVSVAQYEWGCTDNSFAGGNEVPPGLSAINCDNVRQSAGSVRLDLDGSMAESYTLPAGVYSHRFGVDLTGKTVGDHTLQLRGYTTEGNAVITETAIEIRQGRGELTLSRNVARNGQAIDVTMFITNTGNGIAYVDYIDDYVRGFQVIEKGVQLGRLAPAGNYYQITSDSGSSPDRTVHIDLYSDADNDEMVLAAGESFVISYRLVPILYPQSEAHYIGNDPSGQHASRVYYRAGGVPGTFGKVIYGSGNWINGSSLESVVQSIAAGSDYILVTSPAGLAAYTVPFNWRTAQSASRELSMLLSSIAELATLRNGVLGFLPINPCWVTVDTLLEPGGLWADALHPNFRAYHAGGYVLLVGEEEIIPTQGTSHDSVPYSDLRYASTSGESKPELVLGRVVGDDLGTLRRALDTAIYVAETGSGFDRQRAVLFSGRGNGVDTFWTQLNQVSSRLDFPEVTRLKGKNYNDSDHKVLEDFSAEMAQGQSLVVFRGHGAYNSWDNSGIGFSASDVETFNFNNYHPFAFGITCLSGDYKGGYSMAEAWLRYGAGAFIGAISPSDRDTNGRAGRAFFNRWGDNGALTVGYTFTDMARDHWGDDSDWRRWIYQYHLYGDPKYGAMPGAVRTLAPAAPNGPTGAIQITIPGYTVTTDEEGWDHVSLPDDREWIELGDYIVPTWKVSYTYPQGQRVQGVTLTAQSGLTVATGLHIPTATLEIDCDCGVAPESVVRHTAAITGWHPQFEQDYAWEVFENPDGTSALELTLYPFTYNPTTTDARFFQEWSFDVAVFTTSAKIVSLATSKDTYPLVEQGNATLVINNGGDAQSFVIQGEVYANEDEDAVGSIPLRTLHAISGTATLDLALPSALGAGDYTLVVTLSDLDGRVLDTERAGFIQGIAESVVTDLSATPEPFQIGDTVALSLTFQNSGDLALDGVATLRVQTGDRITQTAEFTQTFTGFAPGASLHLNANWNTTGAPDATAYRVVGYVQAGNFTSAPQEITLNVRSAQNIYLPLILR